LNLLDGNKNYNPVGRRLAVVRMKLL